MANQEQLKILKEGIRNWNRWRKDNRDVNIDLRETDLRRADLRRADFGGAKLKKANLMGANLGKANLRGADLWDANLRGADFMGANLGKAHLDEANFTGAILKEADLTDANLRKAGLEEVDLTRANLTNANLMGANLSGADLSGADFTDSRIGYTIFGSNDLSSSIGLERIRHSGPSIIGTHTIRNSKGKIPIEFLRGCGLSNLEIESAKLVVSGLDPDQVAQITYEIHRLYCDQPVQFYSCFISYNSKDQDFAQRLHDDLQDNGVRCWFAPEDLKIGDEFRKAIGKEIRIRDKLLIILSENSIQSEWVGDEVEKALAEEKDQGALKLFPIRLDDTVLRAKDDWAEKIRLRRHIGDFSTEYARAFQRLLRDLKQ